MPQTLLTNPATAESLYDEAVQALPAAERLKLATLILNRIAPESVVDYGTDWSEEDLQDFSNATFALIEEHLEAENNATG